MRQNGLALAAILAFFAVALGAFGAHGLAPVLARHGTGSVWQTAFLYHFLHALALLQYFLWNRGPRWIAHLFLLGIFLFSGSLYVLAATGYRKLGIVTPFGGLLFLIAWLGWAKAACFPKT